MPPRERVVPDSAQTEPVINQGFTTGGDLTIRSSDRINFSVHSLFLSVASPTLADLLPTNARPEVLNLAETADVVALMLGFIYPRPPPTVSTFELLDKALHAAKKYQLEGMTADLRERLCLVNSAVSVYTDPLAALVIATSHSLNEEATLAAQVVSQRFQFHKEADLSRLLDAAPDAAALIKLTGLPLVQTRILVDVLFSFNKAPMQLPSGFHSYLLCGQCRPMYQGVVRYGAPEWQARWAYWAFMEIRDRPLGECEEYFRIAFCNVAWFKAGSSSIPAGTPGKTCNCLQQVTSNSYYFDQWASGVYAHLTERLSILNQYRPQTS